MKKQVLYLIGGSGFIGKNLVEHFYRLYNLVVVDKYIDELFFKDYPDTTIVKGDLTEINFGEDVPNPDFIINLCSIVSAERDLSLFDKMVKDNIAVLLNLYDKFKNTSSLRLFIQFGSSEEYGNVSSPFKESMREEPNSPYALIKQLTVNTSLMLYRNYSFPVLIVRPGNLFGKYQNTDKFIPYVLSCLKKNEDINVTPCEHKRDYMSITDFSRCIEKILLNYQRCLGKIVNISGGKSVQLKYVIDYCKDVLKSDSKVNYGAIPYRANEIMDMRSDISALEEIIGENLLFDLDKELKSYIENFK